MATQTCVRSPELISLVLSHLSEFGSVAAYATVSKEWQAVVESETFYVLHLTPARLADFARIVSGSRRYLVRCFKYLVILDSYSDKERAVFETPEEEARNNKVFTKAIHEFFGIVSTWRPEEVRKDGINLFLKATSPSDLFSTKEPGKAIERWRQAEDGGMNGWSAIFIHGRDLANRRFERSYLRLIKLDDIDSGRKELLPTVSVITGLDINYDDIGIRVPRRIWPAAASTIVSKLSRLRTVHFAFLDDEKRDLSLRKHSRNGKYALPFIVGIPIDKSLMREILY